MQKTAMSELLRADLEALRQEVALLRAENRMLLGLAHRDPLTGIFNRRYFDARVAEELSRCARRGAGFAIAIADLDRFKQVNDRFGHAIGDQVLCSFARLLDRSLRADEACCRIGGDEFGILLPQSTAAEVDRLLARLRHEHRTAALYTPLPVVDFSIGVALCPDHGVTIEDLLEHADEMLYHEKHNKHPADIATRALCSQ
jgi:diguanylate cyclase (GGDEF)-like protein